MCVYVCVCVCVFIAGEFGVVYKGHLLKDLGQMVIGVVAIKTLKGLPLYRYRALRCMLNFRGSSMHRRVIRDYELACFDRCFAMILIVTYTCMFSDQQPKNF